MSAPAPAITLTPEALEHLKKLRADAKAPGDHSLLVLRVGVKQGGCSGMSYVMDFEAPDKITSDDHGEYETHNHGKMAFTRILWGLWGTRGT